MLTQELRSNLLDNPLLFYTHTIAAPVALMTGIWQFLPVTRRNAYHRWAGRLYVACVAVGSVTGFAIAMTTAIGPPAGIPFAILAVLWLAATAKAWLLARAGNFSAHRRWMIRSYALSCAAITLRIISPIGVSLGADFADSYIAAAWGCWTINLAIAELIVRRSARRRRAARVILPT